MLGDIISELRRDYGMTQDYLAAYLNVARSTVASWETGVNEPGIDVIKSLADLFNVSCDYILERTKEKTNLNLETMANKDLLLKINALLQGYDISKK